MRKKKQDNDPNRTWPNREEINYVPDLKDLIMQPLTSANPFYPNNEYNNYVIYMEKKTEVH